MQEVLIDRIEESKADGKRNLDSAILICTKRLDRDESQVITINAPTRGFLNKDGIVSTRIR